MVRGKTGGRDPDRDSFFLHLHLYKVSLFSEVQQQNHKPFLCYLAPSYYLQALYMAHCMPVLEYYSLLNELTAPGHQPYADNT